MRAPRLPSAVSLTAWIGAFAFATSGCGGSDAGTIGSDPGPVLIGDTGHVDLGNDAGGTDSGADTAPPTDGGDTTPQTDLSPVDGGGGPETGGSGDAGAGDVTDDGEAGDDAEDAGEDDGDRADMASDPDAGTTEPCATDRDCSAPLACIATSGPEGVYFGCGDPPGDGDPFEVCTTGDDCASGLCLDTGAGPRCAPPCASDADCGAESIACADQSIAEGSGGAATVRVCSVEIDGPCVSEADCAEGFACAVLPDDAGGFETRCVSDLGGADGGDPCSADTSCASLLCAGGLCAIPCGAHADCLDETLCGDVEVARAGASGTLSLCEEPEPQPCASNRDCADGVRVCGDVRTVEGVVQAWCTFPNTEPPSLPTGAGCSDESECHDDYCLGTTGECTSICEDAALDCVAGQMCTSYRVSGTPVGFCAFACTDNDDCAGGAEGNVCSVNSNYRDNTIDLVCEAPAGPGDLGAECSTGSECVSGLCLRTVVFSSRSCTEDAQCDAGEACVCPADDPACDPSEQRCQLELRACTMICDEASDCAGGVPGNSLDRCSENTTIALPDRTGSVRIRTCAR